jgi:hypothetical protein
MKTSTTTSLAAKLLFETAVESHYANSCKWNISSQTHMCLTGASEESGIPYGILHIAMGELVAKKLLRDVHDTCRGMLKQNLSTTRYITPTLSSIPSEPTICMGISFLVQKFLARYSRESVAFAEFVTKINPDFSEYSQELQDWLAISENLTIGDR